MTREIRYRSICCKFRLRKSRKASLVRSTRKSRKSDSMSWHHKVIVAAALGVVVVGIGCAPATEEEAAPSAGIQEGMTGAVDTDRARRETRDRVQSDDAASIDEALFHGMARALSQPISSRSANRTARHVE